MSDIQKILGEQLASTTTANKTLTEENAMLRAQVRELERKVVEARWQGQKLQRSDGENFSDDDNEEFPNVVKPVERDHLGIVEYDEWGTRRPLNNMGDPCLTHRELYRLMNQMWPSKPIKVIPQADTTPPTRRGKR